MEDCLNCASTPSHARPHSSKPGGTRAAAAVVAAGGILLSWARLGRVGYERCNHRREDTCHEERRVPWAEAALRLSPMEALSFAKLSAALKAWSSTGAAEM